MLNEDEHDDVALAEFKGLLTKLVERVDQMQGLLLRGAGRQRKATAAACVVQKLLNTSPAAD